MGGILEVQDSNLTFGPDRFERLFGARPVTLKKPYKIEVVEGAVFPFIHVMAEGKKYTFVARRPTKLLKALGVEW